MSTPFLSQSATAEWRNLLGNIEGWIPINTTHPNQGSNVKCTALLVDPLKQNQVWALLNDAVIYQSQDSGAKWSQLGQSAGEMTAITALAVGRDSPRYLFASTDSHGVWRYKLPNR